MNVNRLALGVFAIGVAVIFFTTALGYPARAANMPLIYSVVVALFGAAMVGQEVWASLRRRRAGAGGTETVVSDAVAEDEAPAAGQHGRRKQWKAMAAFLMAVLYLYGISLLGYVLATVAFMAVALSMIGHVSWRFALVGIVVLVTVVCLVFIGFLGLPVPLLPPSLT